MISTGRKFFPPSIENLQIFLKNPRSHITRVVPAHNLFQMHLWDIQFISAIFLMQTIFFPITIPPSGGKLMVRP